MMCSTQMMVMPSSSRMCAQHVGGLVHLGLVKAAEAFVGEQQFWRGSERFCQLELLQPGSAEAVDAGMAVGRQADHGQRSLGRLLSFDAAVAALAVEAGERDVLEDGQAAEGARNLKGAADAAVDDPVRREARDLVPGEQDRPGGRRQRAGEHVEDRALARTVGTDQAEDLALVDPKRHVVHGGEAAKPLHQPADFQHQSSPFLRVLRYWLL
ncbi:hypothetical protein AB7M41_004003 [Bradyrhizobium diazoefficiens]